MVAVQKEEIQNPSRSSMIPHFQHVSSKKVKDKHADFIGPLFTNMPNADRPGT
jgi:hypothetical protein